MEEFKVIKDYCGVKKGSKQKSKDPFTVRHMLKEGYWEKIEPIKRKKKIEPIGKRSKK